MKVLKDDDSWYREVTIIWAIIVILFCIWSYICYYKPTSSSKGVGSGSTVATNEN